MTCIIAGMHNTMNNKKHNGLTCINISTRTWLTFLIITDVIGIDKHRMSRVLIRQQIQYCQSIRFCHLCRHMISKSVLRYQFDIVVLSQCTIDCLLCYWFTKPRPIRNIFEKETLDAKPSTTTELSQLVSNSAHLANFRWRRWRVLSPMSARPPIDTSEYDQRTSSNCMTYIMTCKPN